LLNVKLVGASCNKWALKG